MAGILKREDAAARLGISLGTLDRRVNPSDKKYYDPTFPKPVRDGRGRLLGYNSEDLDAWRGVLAKEQNFQQDAFAQTIAKKVAEQLRQVSNDRLSIENEK